MGVKFKMWEERPITKKRGPRNENPLRAVCEIILMIGD